MNIRNTGTSTRKPRGVIAGIGGSLRLGRRLTVAIAVAALLFGPLLLTGDGEIFVLNAVGLGIIGLFIRRFTMRRQMRRSRR